MFVSILLWFSYSDKIILTVLLFSSVSYRFIQGWIFKYFYMILRWHRLVVVATGTLPGGKLNLPSDPPPPSPSLSLTKQRLVKRELTNRRPFIYPEGESFHKTKSLETHRIHFVLFWFAMFCFLFFSKVWKLKCLGQTKLENLGGHLLSEDDHSYWGASISEYNERNSLFG